MPRAKPRTKRAPILQLKGSRPRRYESIRVMLFEAEKQALVQYALRRGLDVSTWMRQLALTAAGYLDDNG